MLCFSLCTLLSQCLFKVETCSEYLKVSSKPNEVSVTLPSAASATHCFIFFVSTRAGRGGGGEVNFADFHAVDSDEEAAGLFSARCAPSPAPSQQNVKYLLDFFLLLFFLLLLFGFHVDVISKLCLWLSPFVFDWST